MSKKNFLIFGFLSFVFLLAFIPSGETERDVYDLDEMVERSEVIVIGSVQSTWVDFRPFDEYIVVDTAKIRVNEWLKNEQNSDTLEIRFYGYWAKTIDDLRGKIIFDNPVHNYETGQKILALASYEDPTMVMGEGYYPFFEGKFVIQNDIAQSVYGELLTVKELRDNVQKEKYSKKIDSVSSQTCAELFDKIHEDFKNTPCSCCNPPPGEPVCEPVGFDTILATNKEFRDSGCEFTYKDWIHLTDDIETASWVMYPSYFNIDMLKTNLSKEIPISISYRGYDECMSFKVVIKNHEGKRPIVSERTYKNICSTNEQKEYRLPLYKVQLTDHGEPIMLPKGNYQLLLYKVIDGQVIDEESGYIGQFFFSSHYDDKTQSEKSDYDYTKPSSEVLRDTKCAEWFDKIMQTGKSPDEEFGLKYELTETNVFRDLECAKFVKEWESLTEHDVWSIGISWQEIASIHDD